MVHYKVPKGNLVRRSWTVTKFEAKPLYNSRTTGD